MYYRSEIIWSGYKNFENREKSNIFRKYDDKPQKKYAGYYLRFSRLNP